MDVNKSYNQASIENLNSTSVRISMMNTSIVNSKVLSAPNGYATADTLEKWRISTRSVVAIVQTKKMELLIKLYNRRSSVIITPKTFIKFIAEIPCIKHGNYNIKILNNELALFVTNGDCSFENERLIKTACNNISLNNVELETLHKYGQKVENYAKNLFLESTLCKQIMLYAPSICSVKEHMNSKKNVQQIEKKFNELFTNSMNSVMICEGLKAIHPKCSKNANESRKNAFYIKYALFTTDLEQFKNYIFKNVCICQLKNDIALINLKKFL